MDTSELTEGIATKIISCPICNKTTTREITIIAPEAYIDPENAGITSIFNCEGCMHPIAIRYTFKRMKNESILVEAGLASDAEKVYKIRPPKQGITIKPKARSYKR